MFVENGANLIIKDRMTIYDNASLICDGRINVGRQGSICMDNGGILYTSPESTIKLNADSHLYSTDYASSACLGEMIKINGLEDDKRRTFFPTIISAVKTITDPDGDILTHEAVSCEYALKALSAKWYTLAELPAGETSENLTVLFSNGSSMKFSFENGKLLGIQGTSVRDIWEYSADK